MKVKVKVKVQRSGGPPSSFWVELLSHLLLGGSAFFSSLFWWWCRSPFFSMKMTTHEIYVFEFNEIKRKVG